MSALDYYDEERVGELWGKLRLIEHSLESYVRNSADATATPEELIYYVKKTMQRTVDLYYSMTVEFYKQQNRLV